MNGMIGARGTDGKRPGPGTVPDRGEAAGGDCPRSCRSQATPEPGTVPGPSLRSGPGTVPDLARPDLARPDLARPDLALPGLALRADLLLAGGILLGGLALCGVRALANRAALEAAGPPPEPEAVAHRVDLAAAGLADLQLLPGVGPRLAARIAEERAAGGPFRSLEDLDRRVAGVGPARVRWWRGRVALPPEEAR